MKKVSFGSIEINEVSKNHLHEIMDSNKVTMGKKVELFENEWKKTFGNPYNIAVSSGTDADTASCMSLYEFGAKRGDEIIVPALAFISVANSILQAGFTPNFVDIERETLNLNSKKIGEKINSKTRAIMAVHTMGKPCDMDTIMEISKKHHLFVIEDSCEAHGAKYNGKNVGSFGDLATFSCYIAHLVQSGEGGMISTYKPSLDKLLRSIRDHGREGTDFDPKYFNHVRGGSNFRMNDLEAALGLGSIEEFKSVFNKRKENLYYLLEKVKDLEEFAYFNLEEDHEIIAPHAFSVVLKDKKFGGLELYKFLRENNITCKRTFGSIPTQHKAFEFMNHKFGEFPEAEYVGDNGLHFGIHQYLPKKNLDYASEMLHKYFKKF